MNEMTKAVGSMNRRIAEMGHKMRWDISGKATRGAAWRTLRAEGRCKVCGGTAAARLYQDGEFDIGGAVLATECAG